MFNELKFSLIPDFGLFSLLKVNLGIPILSNAFYSKESFLLLELVDLGKLNLEFIINLLLIYH
jgi:hypothetical protein